MWEMNPNPLLVYGAGDETVTGVDIWQFYEVSVKRDVGSNILHVQYDNEGHGCKF